MANRERLTLLIDADVLTYVHASKGQRSYAFDEGDPTLVVEPLEEVIEAAENELASLQRKFKTDDVVLAYSCPKPYFRHSLLPEYKGGRAEKPHHYAALRAHLETTCRSYVKPGLEGDDVLGILATHPKLIPGEKLVVSIDKDMRQVPGRHYNPGKRQEFVITPQDGERFFYTQVLTGDSTDGYKGCPGVGPVTAEKLLSMWDSEPLSPWSIVLDAYMERGLTAAGALNQARVARILQHTDYDFKRKEPILWNPPSSA